MHSRTRSETKPRSTHSRATQAQKLASNLLDRLKEVKSHRTPATESESPISPSEKSLILDLIYEEYCRRCEAGENPDPDEFCAQFPALKSYLQRLIVVHDGFEQFLPPMESYSPATENRPRPSPATWPQLGEKFLGFNLLRQLGQGAVGRVFLAEEPALGNRRVAVKIARELGEAEAGTLGRLRHPNIVPVHSIQKDEATCLTAVCMPYLGEATLCNVLDKALTHSGHPTKAKLILDAIQETGFSPCPAADRQPVPRVMQKGTYIDGVLHIAVQLADALAFAHQHGVCHRDLKPSNVLMTPDGTPMLLDFNLSHDDQRTSEDKVGGTLPYMSAEQLMAIDPNRPTDRSFIDYRSDLFSLGVILYELLTRTHPFGTVNRPTPLAEMRRYYLERQQAGTTPARVLNPQIGRSLSRLLDQCLAYNPKDRPQSATELAQALRKHLSCAQRSIRWICTHRRISAAVVVAGLTLGSTGAYVLAHREPASVRQFRLGESAYREDRLVPALAYLDQAIEAEPDMAKAHFARGQVYLRMADRDEEQGNKKSENLYRALSSLKQADELASDGFTKSCIGYCYQRQRKVEAAKLYYEDALKAGISSAALFNNLGLCLVALEKFEEAREKFDRALKLDPQLQQAYYNRARYWLIRVPQLKQELDNKAKCQEAQKRALQAGMADMRKAMELGPISAQLYIDAARLCAFGIELDGNWGPTAVGYLTKAAELGADIKTTLNGAAFRKLQADPAVKALLALPPSPSGQLKRVDLFVPMAIL